MSAEGGARALHAEARALLADAFAEDPWARYVLGASGHDRPRALAAVMRVPVDMAARHGGLVAERNAGGALAAVSTWVPGDRHAAGVADVVRAGALAQPVTVGPATMARLLRDEVALGAVVGGALHPGDAYLWVLGVARARHGQGLGRVVVDRTAGEAAARGFRRLVLNTDNPGNVAIYRRLGFDLLATSARPSGLTAHVLARPLR